MEHLPSADERPRRRGKEGRRADLQAKTEPYRIQEAKTEPYQIQEAKTEPYWLRKRMQDRVGF